MWVYLIGNICAISCWICHYVLLRFETRNWVFTVFNLMYKFFLGKKPNLGKNVSMNTQHGSATEIAVETTIPKQGQNLW